MREKTKENIKVGLGLFFIIGLCLLVAQPKYFEKKNRAAQEVEPVFEASLFDLRQYVGSMPPGYKIV